MVVFHHLLAQYLNCVCVSICNFQIEAKKKMQSHSEATTTTQLDPLFLQDKKTQCIYTHCYCEENIWKLCEKLKTENHPELDHCYAIFLSSDNSVLPMWYQKDNGELIIWGKICSIPDFSKEIIIITNS